MANRIVKNIQKLLPLIKRFQFSLIRLLLFIVRT